MQFGAFDPAKNEEDLEQSLEALPERVAVKKLLMVAEMAQSRAESPLINYDVFVRCLRDVGL